MTRFVTTTEGVGRLEGESVELLDVPFRDLGQVLALSSLQELAGAPVGESRASASLEFLSPVPRPGKIWAAGWSYRAHAQEGGRESPVDEETFFFLKAPSSVVGNRHPIRLPAVAPARVDYEGELALVVGDEATDVSPDSAWAHIAGFTIANDVSARDVQKGEVPSRPANVNLAKSFDTFTPMGPCLVTLDEFADPRDLALITRVDDAVRQDARTSELIRDPGEQLAYLSRFTTLEPGDVILTGTPAGVGYPDRRFLQPGMKVRVEIEGIGVLENVVETAPGNSR